MSKLCVYIYLNFVAFPPSLKSCGLKMSWSWGVAKKFSKLPSRRGLQKNHAQFNENQKHPWGEALSAKKKIKNTLEERHPEKLWSTSKYRTRLAVSVKKNISKVRNVWIIQQIIKAKSSYQSQHSHIILNMSEQATQSKKSTQNRGSNIRK